MLALRAALDLDDRVLVEQVVTMPGMTAESQVPTMFAADGPAYPELLDRIIRAALTKR